MCHLFLLMPLLALPVFWLVPAGPAATIYSFIVVVSGLLYWFIIRSMRQPVVTGAEGLVGTEVEVVSRLGAVSNARYLVRSRGELWSAGSAHPLQPGERVSVTAVNGITLVVSRPDTGANPSSPGHNSRDNRGGLNARHCH